MTENYICCFIQGVDSKFLVNIEGIETIVDLRDLIIQVFMGIPVGTSVKKIVKEASIDVVSTQIRELTETVQVLIEQNRDMIEQNRVLLENNTKKTKFVTKGKEINELCKTRVLRVGDEFRFEKKFDTLTGIKINHIFKIVAIDNNTYAPTVQIKDEKVLVVDGVVMLERHIIENHVKEEIRRQIEHNKKNFLKKLQDYNRKHGGGTSDGSSHKEFSLSKKSYKRQRI
ncbi:hypothetical protein C1646_780239 [Rhizophagus diaphanus]|nr:hypothetical protein C1646_780239 [Rhizophagus diaphanus] [Rhizophagus sp. MUCL 43196]